MKLLGKVLRKCRKVLGLPGRSPASPPTEPIRAPSAESKRRKLERLRPLLREDLPFVTTPQHYNFLTAELQRRFNIVETENISCHDYDLIAHGILERCKDGLVLDCGAGLRRVYYDNVVNFEICPYPSTDVLGVGECLPFRDDSFDAVFSLNVLEHVKDPFACAREIARVMKPRAVLYCVVPFLQPLHGYPHHYYNMTHQGLRNLFDGRLCVHRQEVLGSGLPIWTLAHILQRWASGLGETTRRRFLNMTVADLLADPLGQLDKPFVTELGADINLELASTTALIASKAGPTPDAGRPAAVPAP